MTAFDAVVIGAGPAGSATAIGLARAGWRVALVERQVFPRRKVCGECIAAGNLPLLEALGLGPALEQHAGAELRQVMLLQADSAVSADLPVAPHARHGWGRALDRERLDLALLDQARAAGAQVLQPWSVRAVHGEPGNWRCELRAADSAVIQCLRAAVIIDAHGSWDASLAGPAHARPRHHASDLLAFKANFSGTSLRPGTISVLALDGGYGGMVLADGGIATVACCIRRDRLNDVRGGHPGLRAGNAVEAWLQQQCRGVRVALQGAVRVGPWLASGPIEPGARVSTGDGLFRVGNAAGEAHPILGEGLSMALQSAALLCDHLSHLPQGTRSGHAAVQRRYAADWQRVFGPRLRFASALAHMAMRPRLARLLMAAARTWPGLLTRGARWGAKADPAIGQAAVTAANPLSSGVGSGGRAAAWAPPRRGA